MNRGILDTSVIVKSIFKPPKSLSSEIYKRELETHKKCKFVVKKIEERDVDIYIPKVCVVETAAVVKRLSDRDFAIKISEGVFNSYEVVDEAILFDSAWATAMDTGCSGFDSYFIALAKRKDAVLFTDDGRMHFHAKENQSLQKIAKGTGIIFTGNIIGMLLAFVGRVIIVRYTDKFKYSENQFYSEGIK